jgi:pteridine reductase
VELAGRRALVTGAGIRVGRAIALGLAGRGAHVAVHYHASQAGAQSVAADITALGLMAPLLKADLADAAAAEALPARAAEALGKSGLDVVVNSAAIMERRSLADVTPADWDRTIDVNLRGTFFVVKGAAALMERSGGAIVNIADLAAFERWTGYPVHVISKSGVVALTEVLARALAPRIRVNAVAPGAVLLPEGTPDAERAQLERTTPLGRLGSPQDVVDAVLYLLAQDYVTGQTIVVDGGRHVR